MSQEKVLSDSISKNNPQNGYDHARWESMRRFLRFLIRVIGFGYLAKLDRVEGLENIPLEGPGIVMMNHIAFLDSLTVIHVLPRHIVPLAKIEVYNYPLIGIFPRLWGVIPVRREEFDRRAVQGALEVLKAGELILIAPEATRSPRLQYGKEGVAYIASRAGAAVIPVGIDGSPGFPAFRTSRRWKEPGITVKFGQPFRFRFSGPRPDRNQLRQMTDEALYRLARLLPEERRGYYSNLQQATEETIEMV